MQPQMINPKILFPKTILNRAKKPTLMFLQERSNIADGVINGFSKQTMLTLTGAMELSMSMGLMQSCMH